MIKSSALHYPVTAIGFVFFMAVVQSCAHTRIEDFPFIDTNGASIELTETPAFRPGEEGKLYYDGKKFTTPVYQLKQKNNEGMAEDCLFVNYQGSLVGSVVIFYGENTEIHSLPDSTAEITEAVFHLHKDSVMTGFAVESEEDSPQWRIRGAGFRPDMNGIKIEQDIPVLSEGYGYDAGNGYALFSLPESKDSTVKIEYRIDSADLAEAEICVFDENDNQPIIISLLSGTHNIFIPLEYYTGKVYVKDSGSILKIGLYDNRENYVDLGLLINPFDALESEFEIYRWTDFPDILLVDTLDYAVQSGLFKRLAYYVEKRGYAGTLLSDEQLEKLHGWNAHDYRAIDLAEFFNLAAHNSITLTSYEDELAKILTDKNILKIEGNGYVPIEGGIISVSRESSEYLRELFLAHEGYHGIFFSEPGFEKYVVTLYSGFDEQFIRFWKLFLNWKGYDTSNAYLMANEVQAYLLQQPLERVDAYYKEYVIPNMITQFPDDAAFLEMLITDDYTLFFETASSINEYIRSRTGYGAGDLFSLRRSGERIGSQ